jgi:hypothetical protein
MVGVNMTVKTSTKAVEGLKALKALQEDAKRRGLDKMNMDEINAEIASYRREKRITVLAISTEGKRVDRR